MRSQPDIDHPLHLAGGMGVTHGGDPQKSEGSSGPPGSTTPPAP